MKNPDFLRFSFLLGLTLRVTAANWAENHIFGPTCSGIPIEFNNVPGFHRTVQDCGKEPNFCRPLCILSKLGMMNEQGGLLTGKAGSVIQQLLPGRLSEKACELSGAFKACWSTVSPNEQLSVNNGCANYASLLNCFRKSTLMICDGLKGRDASRESAIDPWPAVFIPQNIQSQGGQRFIPQGNHIGHRPSNGYGASVKGGHMAGNVQGPIIQGQIQGYQGSVNQRTLPIGTSNNRNIPHQHQHMQARPYNNVNGNSPLNGVQLQGQRPSVSPIYQTGQQPIKHGYGNQVNVQRPVVNTYARPHNLGRSARVQPIQNQIPYAQNGMSQQGLGQQKGGSYMQSGLGQRAGISAQNKLGMAHSGAGQYVANGQGQMQQGSGYGQNGLGRTFHGRGQSQIGGGYVQSPPGRPQLNGYAPRIAGRTIQGRNQVGAGYAQQGIGGQAQGLTYGQNGQGRSQIGGGYAQGNGHRHNAHNGLGQSQYGRNGVGSNHIRNDYRAQQSQRQLVPFKTGPVPSMNGNQQTSANAYGQIPLASPKNDLRVGSVSQIQPPQSMPQINSQVGTSGAAQAGSYNGRIGMGSNGINTQNGQLSTPISTAPQIGQVQPSPQMAGQGLPKMNLPSMQSNPNVGKQGPPTGAVQQGPPTNVGQGPPTNVGQGAPPKVELGPPTNVGQGPPPKVGQQGPPPPINLGQNVGKQGPPTNVGQQGPTPNLGQGPSPINVGQNVGKPGPLPNLGQQGPPTNVGQQGPTANVGQQGPPTNVGQQGPPTNVGQQGPPTKVGQQGPPTNVGQQGPSTNVGQQGPQLQLGSPQMGPGPQPNAGHPQSNQKSPGDRPENQGDRKDRPQNDPENQRLNQGGPNERENSGMRHPSLLLQQQNGGIPEMPGHPEEHMDAESHAAVQSKISEHLEALAKAQSQGQNANAGRTLEDLHKEISAGQSGHPGLPDDHPLKQQQMSIAMQSGGNGNGHHDSSEHQDDGGNGHPDGPNHHEQA